MDQPTPLQQRVRQEAKEAGVDMDIIDAGGHIKACRCYKCKKYWLTFLPHPDDDPEDIAEFWSLCPFQKEELLDGRSSATD